MKREGHSLPLRWQSQTEGPPPLDAFFAFGSKAPNPLSSERALELNHVFINIWGLRSGLIAGLGLLTYSPISMASIRGSSSASQIQRRKRAASAPSMSLWS